MPVLIHLTTAEHGGRVSTGKCGSAECGVSCECGCPYTAMIERGHTQPIEVIEATYPNQWLGLVIPPEEDDFAPQRALLVVHSPDDTEVWDAISRVTHNQIVHVYYNGIMSPIEQQAWAESTPDPLGAHAQRTSLWGDDIIPLRS